MKIPCRKCLLAQTDPHGIYKEIKEMIDALPDEKRADKDTYSRRLEICGACPYLGEGTCGKCGCFAELRAAKKDMHCPAEERFW